MFFQSLYFDQTEDKDITEADRAAARKISSQVLVGSYHNGLFIKIRIIAYRDAVLSSVVSLTFFFISSVVLWSAVPWSVIWRKKP